MKFSIRGEFLDTKLLVLTLPKASRANSSELINARTTIMNYGNFNPRVIFGTARRKEHCVAVLLVTFVRQDLKHVRLLRQKPNILRDLFINISRTVPILFLIVVGLRALILYINDTDEYPVQMKTHVQSDCLCSINLLFCGVIVAVNVVVA